MEPLYLALVVSCAINGWLWMSRLALKTKADFLTIQVLSTGGVLANLLVALHAYSTATKEQEFKSIFGEILTTYPRNLVSGAANSFNSAFKDKTNGK